MPQAREQFFSGLVPGIDPHTAPGPGERTPHQAQRGLAAVGVMPEIPKPSRQAVITAQAAPLVRKRAFFAHNIKFPRIHRRAETLNGAQRAVGHPRERAAEQAFRLRHRAVYSRMIRHPLLKQQGIDRQLKDVPQGKRQALRFGQHPAQKIRNTDFRAHTTVDQFRTQMSFLLGQDCNSLAALPQRP